MCVSDTPPDLIDAYASEDERALGIFAKAMHDIVRRDPLRGGELRDTLRQGSISEEALAPHFKELSRPEKMTCSKRAENLARDHAGIPREPDELDKLEQAEREAQERDAAQSKKAPDIGGMVW